MKNEKSVKTTSKKALHRFMALAAVLLAFCLVFMTPVSAAWTGEGTASSPYQISTADDLKQLAEDVNGGNTYSGKYFQLQNDITLTGEWTPIGTDGDKSFHGTFDGNGKTITINSNPSGNTNVGLFGHISGDGVVKKLTVSGTITVTTDERLTVGGIAGINQGTISSCYSAVTITATTTSTNIANDVDSEGDSLAAGGLVGMNSGVIENSYSSGDVTATAQSVNAFAGGIAGMNAVGILGKSISNCYATGDVKVTSLAGFAGGLVGMNMQTLSKSFALNEKITADGTSKVIDRIAGQNLGLGSTSGSYSYKHMQITPSSSSTENNVCAGAILSSGWSSDIWDLSGNGNYKLPVLKGLSGQPTETPTHIETVTVTFEANGGTPAPGQQTILEGAKVTKPADLTHASYGEGYTFGWYKDTNGNEAWNFETDSFCKDDTSKTLYAKWTPITYKVVFDANGGEGTMAEQGFTYDTPENLNKNTFEREGYTFSGWNTKSDLTGTEYADEASVENLAYQEGAVVPLFANWTAKKYTVQFNANGGSGSMDAQTFTYGVSQKLSPNSFTAPEGKQFNGWAKEQNAEPTFPDNAEVFVKELFPETDGKITLYANWTATPKKTYNVTFVSEGESDYKQTVFEGGNALDPGYTRIGYTLSGWYKTGETVKWDFEKNVVNADITLTAQWTANTYNVKFNSNDGSGSMSDQSFTYGTQKALTKNVFTKEGYTFEGWAESENGPVVYQDEYQVSNLANTENAVVNLYAVWKIGTFTITFADTGDSTIPAITQTYGTQVIVPSDPVRTGYSFSYWDKEIPETMPGESITITAKWIANNYAIKFDANGGAGKMGYQFISYDTSEILTANAFTAPKGKVFAGWNTKADGSGKAYSDKATVKNLASEMGEFVTLYAQWKYPSSGGSSKTTYTVTFNANGGAGEMFQQTFTSGKEKALNLNFFTREGYTFAGWATSADGAVVYTDGETIKVSKSMTLYAVWESDEPVNPDQPGDEPGQPGDEPDKPEEPTEPETPAPILAVLAGLGAAVVLRRK